MSNDSGSAFLRKLAANRSPAGKTRVCPHCKTTILDSANTCPACQRYLRYGEQVEQPRAVPDLSPLKVAATLRHPEAGDAWEYTVVLTVQNERGEEVSRQVVGVGALEQGEQRTFNLAVELTYSKKK